MRNDIALIKMYKPVEFNDGISPICLPDCNYDYAGDNANVIGWGALDYDNEYESDLPTQLQEASAHVLPQQKCKYETKYKPYEITDNIMCAGYDEGTKDPCLEDNGGPFIKLDLILTLSKIFWMNRRSV